MYTMERFLNKIESYKCVITNSAWLFLIQVANYIFPLITLPYMMKTLGADHYGMIAIAQSLMQYINIISDYSFNMTATREIALSRNDPNNIREIFNDVLICKLFIMALCFIVMLAIGLFVFRSENEKIFYLVAFLLVVGNVLFPVWFFQGIEQMKYITYINLISRTISVVLLFTIVKEPLDYILAIAIQGVSGVISGILALLLIYFRFGISIYRWPGRKKIIYLLKDGKEIFIASASGNIYGQGATLITGIIAGSTSAGYYSLGQKISGILANLVQPISQALYPHLCQIFSESQERFFQLKRKIVWGGMGLGSGITISLFLSANFVSCLITGKFETELISVIKIFSVVTLGTMLNVLLHPVIIAMKKKSEIQNIYVSVAIIFILVSVPLASWYGSQGMAYSLLLVEGYIFIRYMRCISYI